MVAKSTSLKALPASGRGKKPGAPAIASIVGKVNGKTNGAKTVTAVSNGKPAPSSLRDDLRRFTRDKIVKAALESFAANGFRATTVEKIVDLAGTTAPTFYRHFAGKDDLLLPLREFLTAEVNAIVFRLNEDVWRSQAGIRQWVTAYVAMWKRVHRLCSAFWEAASEDADYASEAIPETINLIDSRYVFFNVLSPEQQQKTKLRLTLLILFMDRAVALAVAEPNAKVAGQILDELTEILWRSVFKPLSQPG